MFDLKILVLVVDDMRTMRKIVQKSCKEIGFTHFLEAEDGAKAWELINDENNKIDLVISDWNMPNSTGLDLLKRVRASQKSKNLPFILLTAEAEASQVQTALLAGVDDYLIKPFSTSSLRDKLTAVHKKKKAA